MIHIDETLKQDQYVNILYNHLLQFGMKHYGYISKFTFQQDNCGPHRAKSVTAYLNIQNVEAMKWPPQSPDLNPIEDRCDILKRRPRARPENLKNADHLFELLQQEWFSIPDSTLHNLVRPMFSRAIMAQSHRGGSTKY